MAEAGEEVVFDKECHPAYLGQAISWKEADCDKMASKFYANRARDGAENVYYIKMHRDTSLMTCTLKEWIEEEKTIGQSPFRTNSSFSQYPRLNSLFGIVVEDEKGSNSYLAPFTSVRFDLPIWHFKDQSKK